MERKGKDMSRCKLGRDAKLHSEFVARGLPLPIPKIGLSMDREEGLPHEAVVGLSMWW